MTTQTPAPETEELIDVTRQATYTDDGMIGGFDWLAMPVYITPGVDRLTDVPQSNKIASKRGRLHDVLWMGARALGGGQLDFDVLIGRRYHLFSLKLEAGRLIISTMRETYQQKGGAR